jgi:hypothetical protein
MPRLIGPAVLAAAGLFLSGCAAGAIPIATGAISVIAGGLSIADTGLDLLRKTTEASCAYWRAERAVTSARLVYTKAPAPARQKFNGIVAYVDAVCADPLFMPDSGTATWVKQNTTALDSIGTAP